MQLNTKFNIMKTLKLLSILSFIILASCNNDDDAPSSLEQTYFPTQISTVQTGSTNTEIMNIQYNSNNRISQFSFVNGSETNTYDISYNSDGVLTSILNTRANGTTLDYSFSYSNGRVSQLTLTNASSSLPMPVTYDEFDNSYTIISSPNLLFKYDAAGNIIDINPGFGNILFNYNSNEGVYKNIPDNFPFVVVMSLGPTSFTIINTLLFSDKQMTSLSLLGNSLNIETTRNDNNQIETFKFIDPTSFDIQSTSTITYELR